MEITRFGTRLTVLVSRPNKLTFSSLVLFLIRFIEHEEAWHTVGVLNLRDRLLVCRQRSKA